MMLSVSVIYNSNHAVSRTNKVYYEYSVEVLSDIGDANVNVVTPTGVYTFCAPRTKLSVTFYVDNNGVVYLSKPHDAVKRIFVRDIRNLAESFRIYAGGFVKDKRYSAQALGGDRAVLKYEASGKNSRFGISADVNMYLRTIRVVLESVYLNEDHKSVTFTVSAYTP